jgi:hypothetical protein
MSTWVQARNLCPFGSASPTWLVLALTDVDLTDAVSWDQSDLVTALAVEAEREQP